MPESWISRRRINVLLISLAFLFIFASVGTLGGLQKMIQNSIADEVKSHILEGYSLLAVMSLAYSIFLIFSPSLLAIAGNRTCLFIGSVTFMGYVFVLLSRNGWLSNALAFFAGAGNSIMWVAENNYIVQNANDDTLMSDISLFWSLYSASMLLGNIYVAIEFNGVTRIDNDMLTHLFYIASGSICVGMIFLLCLKQPKGNMTKSAPKKPKNALMDLLSLLKKRKMIFFCLLFVFNGFQQAFGLFVYHACVAFTNAFGDMATQMAPISAVTYSAGMCFAGFLSMLLSKFENKCSNHDAYIYCTSVLIQIISLAGTFVNLPDDSPHAPTDNVSFIAPTIWLALVCSFGIGVSEGLSSTQIFAQLGRLYPDHSAESAACYKITKSLSISLFLLSTKLSGLHGLLLFLAFVGLLSIGAFFTIKRKTSAVINET